jgi:hypothetical protein
MKRMRCPISLALTTLLAVGLAAPLAAQQTPTDMVAFKVVSTVKQDDAATYVIPLDPPLVSIKLVGGGDAAPIGKFTAIENPLVRQGVDGNGLWTEAVGVFTGANGDAIFYQYKGVVPRFVAGFVITGGKGRFKGATGSGVMTFGPTANAGEFTCSFDGVISAPK